MLLVDRLLDRVRSLLPNAKTAARNTPSVNSDDALHDPDTERVRHDPRKEQRLGVGSTQGEEVNEDDGSDGNIYPLW